MATIVLDDSLLSRLALNPMVYQAFPFFKPLQQKIAGAGCQCTEGMDVAMLRNSIKQAVAGLAPDKLRLFKTFAGGDRVRIFFTRGQGVADVVV